MLNGGWGFFFYLVCEAIGTVATPGLLCQPRVIVKIIVEKQMECRLAGEIEVLGENLPQHHFCPTQNPTWPDPGLNPGRCGGKPASNCLSYGAAWRVRLKIYDCFKLLICIIMKQVFINICLMVQVFLRGPSPLEYCLVCVTDVKLKFLLK
jgi:hypothetical protein